MKPAAARVLDERREAMTPAPVQARKLKILIVDDEAPNRRLLRAQLQAEGHAVIEAGNGVEALAVLEREPVDAVISDIFMPDMDGYRLCHQVRETPALAELPLVLYSATFKTERDEKLSLELGADVFLRKPATVPEIAGAVAKALTRHHPLRRKDDHQLTRLYSSRMIEKLEEKNAELSHVLHAMDVVKDGILQFDPCSLQFTKVNLGAVAQTGYSRAELLAMTPLDLKPEFDEPRYRALLAPLLDGRVASQLLTTVHRRKDGTRVPVEVLIHSVGRGPGDHAMVAIARDISERQRAEGDLRRFRAAMDEAVDGIFIIDPDTSRILDCNDAAATQGGYDRAELLAMGITDLDPGLGSAAQWRQHVGTFKTSGPLTMDTQSRRKDGSTFPVEVRVRHVASEPQDYMVAVVRDITERKAAEERILRLNSELEQRVVQRTAQLEAANKDLEGFSYSVSHDLRAPLRAIDNFSGFLLEDHAGQLDAEGRRLLGVIRTNTARMGQLINDVLDFSRAGRSEVATTPVDLAALVREVFAEIPTGQAKAGLTVGALPPAMADKAMIRQVLANLLANAAKFSSHRESPAIEVSGRVENGEGIYTVRDNGAGFDPQYAHKLFGVFQRLHRADQFEGTGIGLAIVKRIVSRHGGRVWAESDGKTGAAFSFSLPQRQPDVVNGVAP